jgi:hypothetical protein
MMYSVGYFYKAYIKKLLFNKRKFAKKYIQTYHILGLDHIIFCLRECHLNKRNIIVVVCIAVVMVAGLTLAACSSESSNSITGPVISSLTPEHPDVYPVGNTRVTCVATAKDGGALSYQWVCNDGTITGSGQTITWEAPKTYGDFHIMCTVFDKSGNKASQTATVTVLVRDPTKCCR